MFSKILLQCWHPKNPSETDRLRSPNPPRSWEIPPSVPSSSMVAPVMTLPKRHTLRSLSGNLSLGGTLGDIGSNSSPEKPMGDGWRNGKTEYIRKPYIVLATIPPPHMTCNKTSLSSSHLSKFLPKHVQHDHHPQSIAVGSSSAVEVALASKISAKKLLVSAKSTSLPAMFPSQLPPWMVVPRWKWTPIFTSDDPWGSNDAREARQWKTEPSPTPIWPAKRVPQCATNNSELTTGEMLKLQFHCFFSIRFNYSIWCVPSVCPII